MGSKVKRKFNSHKFRSLIENKIKSKGYRGVNGFVIANGFARNPLARAVLGESRPSIESLNNWCRALGCTQDERAEIISSVYVDDEESSVAA